MSIRKKILITLLCVVVLAFSGCGTKADQGTEVGQKETDTKGEPETAEYGLMGFDVVNLAGETVSQSIFEDYDITMVNIWGTFCGPCIREMPDLQALYLELPEGTNLIGLISDAGSEKAIQDAKTIVEQTGVTYENLIPDQVLYNFLVENVTGVPSTIFVDKDGRIIGDMIVGVRSAEEYMEFLNAALEEIGK